MKQKLMALALVAVLVLGTSTTALADIESPTVNNSVTVESPTVNNSTTVNSPVVDNSTTVNSPVVDNTTPEVNSPVVDNTPETDATPETDKTPETDNTPEVDEPLDVPVEEAEELLEEALESEDPSEARDVLTSLTNEVVMEMMSEDVTKVEQADKAWAEEKDITVETKSEVESVDASKVSIVGAALNADGEEEKDVVLNIAEPEDEVEVDKKYTNGVALDIKLFVAGESKAELDVPVAITMPIPTGVEEKNLVVLHFHADAEEPAVIEPVVNEDGTMTFVVDGFSTFVVANETVIDLPSTGGNNDVTIMLSLLLMAAGVILISKRNAFVK